MRKISGIVIVLTLLAFSSYADEASDHLEHLRVMLREMSNHGTVIPQPDAINPQAAKAISISARSFIFTPSSFTVNQGDVVTVTLSVASNDPSSVGHGMLMETYVEDGLDVGRGRTGTVTFTATTPGTFAWVCTQPTCGEGHSSMFGQMIVSAVVIPPPTISSLFPTSGSTVGGTVVTISGSNFQTSGTTTVKFDTTAATNVNATSATSITVTTPAHTAGTVSLQVTNPDGQTTTSSNAYTYVEPGPSISTVSPSTGSTAGGTQVTIAGAGFQSGAAVTIGGIPALNVIVGSANSITVTTPLGPATQEANQPRDVAVTNPDGKTATKTGAFAYFVPPLVVLSIDPGVGLPGGGTVVTITGTGFTTGVISSVTFGGSAGTNVKVINAVTLQATCPAHALGTVDVVVTLGGISVTKAAAFNYLVPPPRRRSAHH